MIINELDRTVTIENPFEILHRPIAFFSQSESGVNPIYFKFLDKDGYIQNDESLTFCSFSDFNSNPELQACMLFEKDRGYVFRKECFKIILSEKFHEFVKQFNNINIEVVNEENLRNKAKAEFYKKMDFIEKCTKEEISESCNSCTCRDYCIRSGIGKKQVQNNIAIFSKKFL